MKDSTPLEKREDVVNRLRKVSHFYDSAFRIPGTQIRVGWDSIFGLIPGVGDLVGVIPLAYNLRVARRFGLGKRVYTRLIFNQLVDFILGSIPLVGDIFDWAFRANVKNADLLISKIEKQAAA
ncbi:DUF4112 domain-containing protein [Pelagicoccus albus]|uniref:DUF4112 domain-containing protein n=1 Tax=Pelagicoccus albus TaxID=415222 RepID=A0A7X1B340_9BACT|nr:DUF4112 domain-containing protein [Pelagicoccus albus]MBC2604765.1 DUF4112 domain-containing protein [Pelagicoccus albus]